MQTISRKFTIALVTTLIFSVLFSLVGYTELAKQYFSFGTMIFTFVVLSAPMFLLAGVALSYLFEKFLRSEWMKFFSYIVMGAVLTIPYTMYIFNNSGSTRFALIGAFGAALFYGVQKLFQKYVFTS